MTDLLLFLGGRPSEYEGDGDDYRLTPDAVHYGRIPQVCDRICLFQKTLKNRMTARIGCERNVVEDGAHAC